MGPDSPRSGVAGADAARIGKVKGWAVVLLESGMPKVEFLLSLQPLVESERLVAVDIPIGLPGDRGIALDNLGRRRADGEAYDLVASRRKSVFWAPPRRALDQPYAEAREHCSWLSSQAHSLRHRIREVDELIQDRAPFIEYHPKVSFRALAGRPLDYSKKSWNGQEERRRILKDAGLRFPARLQGVVGGLAVDDVLDAAAGALTAQAIIQRRSLALGGRDNVDERDQGVIWYPR